MPFRFDRADQRLTPARRYTAWSRLDSEVNYYECLEEVLKFVDRAVQAGTEVFPESVAVRHAGLAFYETCVTLPLECALPVVVLPSVPFAHACLLADEAAGVARICGVVAKLREALTGEATAVERETADNARMVHRLNEFLVDFINLLWQKKLLLGDDDDTPKAQFGLTSCVLVPFSSPLLFRGLAEAERLADRRAVWNNQAPG